MKVTLKNIKKISELKFEIPSSGVWILTGLNGSGKTTLLASIYRIKAKHAFQRFYKTTQLEKKLDSYENSEIEYEINNNKVLYRYGGQRWRPTPSKNAKLFDQFPIHTVEYIAASSDRIEPYPDEIMPRKLRDARIEVKEFLTNVLEDGKWNDLKYVNTRRGVGNDAYLIPYIIGREKYFFSEKNFSLGELCTLRLAIKISSVPNGSLLLVDEVEMALHPKAQVNLLEQVKRIATSKNLTVIFSTHSATIIKNTNRKQIIHLNSNADRKIFPSVGAFPAQVLGNIAFDDELAADFVIYVEDKQAKMLSEQLISMYMRKCYPENSYRPLYRIAPVGGFVQVIEMLLSSDSIFPNYVKKFALLDEDVQTESIQNANNSRNTNLINLFHRAQDKLNYLPCTPELGVVEMIENETPINVNLLNRINSLIDGFNINITRIISNNEYTDIQGRNVRDVAKAKMTYIVGQMAQIANVDELSIRKALYNEYCIHKYSTNIGELRALLGPIFNAR